MYSEKFVSLISDALFSAWCYLNVV